jgi:hypothetical protein
MSSSIFTYTNTRDQRGSAERWSPSRLPSSTSPKASWWPNKLSRRRSWPSLAMTIIWPFVMRQQRHEHSAKVTWRSSRVEVISAGGGGRGRGRDSLRPAWIFKLCLAKHALMLRVQGSVSHTCRSLRRSSVYFRYSWNTAICCMLSDLP